MTLTTTSGGTPARRKMIETMDMKGLSANTQDTCLSSVSMLARFYGRPPRSLSVEEVDAWVLGRIDAGCSPRTTNVDVAALRLFYVDTMGQPEKAGGLHGRRVPDQLPRSIPEADVCRLIDGINDLRYRTATLLAYGCALRIPEVVALQVDDVRSEDGLLHIAHGKGGHERMAFLPDTVLEALRRYWKNTEPHPESWLFYGAGPERPMTAESLRAAFNEKPRPSGARSRHHVPLSASRGRHSSLRTWGADQRGPGLSRAQVTRGDAGLRPGHGCHVPHTRPSGQRAGSCLLSERPREARRGGHLPPRRARIP